MRDVLRLGMGEVTYPKIRKNFDQRAAAGGFRGVEASKRATLWPAREDDGAKD